MHTSLLTIEKHDPENIPELPEEKFDRIIF